MSTKVVVPERIISSAASRVPAFTNSAVTTTGDGSDVGGTWEVTKADNPHVRYHSNRRGYIACTATRAQMRADFKILDSVTVPDRPARIGGSLVVEAGRPGSNTA